MSNRAFRKKVNSVVFVVLSFLLSLDLFVLSFSVVLEATVLNSHYIMDNMISTDYFVNKSDEITHSLVDLGSASGLKEEFFDGFIDEVMLNTNTEAYLTAYYNGEGGGAKIDVTEFKQSFNAALDDYITENNINDVNAESREYLVNKAANIYRNSLEIPLFSRVAAYILTLKNAMPFIIAGLAAFAVIIILILLFANKWKHRAMRYYCYASFATFLSVGILPIIALATGKMKQINITTRALYELFVQCGNNILLALLLCSVLFFLIAVALMFQYKRMRARVSSGEL